MSPGSMASLPEPLVARAEAMAEVAGLLWERGWAEFIGGNMSVNVTEWAGEVFKPGGCGDPRHQGGCGGPSHHALRRPYPDLAGAVFLVTATFTRMRDVARDWTKRLCLVRLDAAGAGYTMPWRGGPDLRPTSEFNSHLAIHHTNAEIGRDARVVVHTHPTEIIAMTHLTQFKSAEALNRVLWSMMPEAVLAFPEGVGFAPYRMTGTDALEEETVKVIRQHRVCVWEKHGCLAVGADVQDAFDVLDTVNKCARLYFLCKHTGQDPEGIPPEEVEALRRVFVSPSPDAPRPGTVISSESEKSPASASQSPPSVPSPSVSEAYGEDVRSADVRLTRFLASARNDKSPSPQPSPGGRGSKSPSPQPSPGGRGSKSSGGRGSKKEH